MVSAVTAAPAEDRMRLLADAIRAFAEATSDYERLLRARGGVAVAAVNATAFCGGCRVTIRPQAIQELRSGTTPMMRCESCGRYLYWQE